MPAGFRIRLVLPALLLLPPSPSAAQADREPPTPAGLAAALAKVHAYVFGQDREALVRVEEWVHQAAPDPVRRQELAANLAAALVGEATAAGKEFLCRQLSLIGAAAEVPALARLLGDGELAPAARAALERIPGAEAGAALRRALGAAAGSALVGLLHSLGARRERGAVAEIATYLGHGDPAVAAAALYALGRIGGPEAAEAVRGTGPPGPAARDLALLEIALDHLAVGRRGEAAELCRRLCAPGKPDPIRFAAFKALVGGGTEDPDGLLGAALDGEDEFLQAAAVRLAGAAGTEDFRRVLAARLPALPTRLQAQAIQALAGAGDPAVLPALGSVVAGEDRTVRLAALDALGRLGGAAAVPLLAGLAGRLEGEELALLRRSLARLRGEGVGEALVRSLAAASPAGRRELILALAARGERQAVPALLEAAADQDPLVRQEAITALGMLADAAACPRILELLARCGDEGESLGLAKALAAVCRRASDPEQALAPLLAALARPGPEPKAPLLRALGLVGGRAALEAVRGAAAAADLEIRLAAIRALAGWPDAAPLPDLLAAAREAAEPQARILSLRGVADLAGKPAGPAPARLAGMLDEALRLAWRPEEKRALLAALGRVPGPAALAAARSRLADPLLAEEAARAVLAIVRGLGPSSGAPGQAALGEALAAASGRALQEEVYTGLLELAGSPNLALGAAATSPDGLEKDHGGGGDQAAIDGDPATYWDEEDNRRCYRLRVALPAAAEVSVVRILGHRHHDYAPKDFEILGDGRAVRSVRGAVYGDNRFTAVFPPVRCRVLELEISGAYGLSPAIRELELYGPLPAAAGPAAAGLGWRQEEGAVALRHGDRTVWRLNFLGDGGKPFFHPLRLADGAELAWFCPPDHPWHRGLWFSWKYINGLNYWEEDPRTGLSPGRTSVAAAGAFLGEDFTASVSLTLAYHPPGQPPVLREKRAIVVGPPDAAGGYRIDWESVFAAAGKEAVLDRTPIPGQEGGRSFGGYAGLGVRLAPVLADWRLRDSEGREGLASHGRNARWLAAGGGLPSGARAGLAILDHPANRRHPSPWHVVLDPKIPFVYFGPALLFHGPLALPVGEELVLRYRILLFPGEGDPARLEEEWQAFAGREGR